MVERWGAPKTALLLVCAILAVSSALVWAAGDGEEVNGHTVSVTLSGGGSSDVESLVVAAGTSVSATATCTCSDTAQDPHDLSWTSISPLTGDDTDGSDGTITGSGTPTTPGTYTIRATCNSATDSAELIVTGDIEVEITSLVSVDQSGITVTATVAGAPLAGKTVSFSSDALDFDSDTAVTDSYGKASVTATASASPSASEDAASVTATYDPGGGGDPISDTANFTVVEVNYTSASRSSIIVGGYTDNSLYTSLLTFTVDPAISGVPLTFEFESGEGEGDEIAAQLEDASTESDASGEGTVRVRSGDLRETATVIGKFEVSSGQTDITFIGIDDISQGD